MKKYLRAKSVFILVGMPVLMLSLFCMSGINRKVQPSASETAFNEETTGDADDVFTVFGEDAPDRERLLMEGQSNLAYNKILESFGAIPQRTGHSSVTGKADYGDYYAGAYLNEEGRLVVLIASDESQYIRNRTNAESNVLSPEIIIGSKDFMQTSDEFQTTAKEFAEISESNDIIFQNAKYSYAYLKALMDQLMEAHDKILADTNRVWSESICSEVTSVGIGEDKNSIVVSILKLDDAKSERFRKEINDSEAIVFENSEGFVQLQ